MLKEVVIATLNEGKLKEFKSLLGQLGIEVHSLDEFKNIPDVEETGKTFEENAKIKAEFIRDLLNIPVIADDSGLVVDALNGQPGIYSARFAGVEKNDQKNNEKLLALLQGVEPSKRTARFISTIALALPKEQTIVVRGTVEGIIGYELKGSNGFGYDPLFFLQEYQKTMAEISPDLKNKISHRARAMQELVQIINKLYM